MPDQTHAFGGGISDTILSPIVLVAMLIAMILILVLPRKYILVPVLVSIILIPLGQQVYLIGVHWLVSRLITLCGLARIAVMKFRSKKDVSAGGFNAVDRAFLGCAICETIGFALQYMQAQALVNQFGILIDTLGAYCLMRVLIQNEKDIYRALKVLALLTVVLAGCMAREQATIKNVFGYLGGIQLVPEVREGKIRSQGSFEHSLTAGTFAAMLLPLFFLLWRNGKAKSMALCGVVGCTVMTMCSNSSTPLLTYVAGVLGMLLWPIRKHMRAVRWGIVIGLLALNVVMKAPVWFIIAHIDLTGGSSGYHRAELVDQFIRHFRDWWLIGTKDAANWGWDMWDQQNQYVNVGEGGGLAAFVLFIVVISRACGRIGKARRSVEGSKREWLLWFLGCSLFANLVGFFGVNYFDQAKLGWFVLLAMISAATAPVLQMNASKALPNIQEEITNRSPVPYPCETPAIADSTHGDWVGLRLG
jgi:hypothetical protein